MIGLSLLLFFSTPESDPGDFFVPPAFDSFAKHSLDDPLRKEEIDKIWTAYEERQENYRANRDELVKHFYMGMSDINLSGDQLDAQLVEYDRQMKEYQGQCIQTRLDLMDHVSEIKWAEYLQELEEKSAKQSEKEDKIILELEEELQEFMDEIIPMLPLPQQAPLKVHVRQFRSDVLEHYREYKRFDVFSHPVLRGQYSTEKQIRKVVDRANRHTMGILYEHLELRERFREALTADQWVHITEALDDLSKDMSKLSLQHF